MSVRGDDPQAARADRRHLQRCRRDAGARPDAIAIMTEALLALGGNVGNSRAILDRAVACCATGIEVRLTARSSDYLHAALGLQIPAALRQSVHRGRDHARPRASCWRARRRSSCNSAATARTRSAGARAPPTSTSSPMTISTLDEPGLTLPHPRLFERAFVLRAARRNRARPRHRRAQGARCAGQRRYRRDQRLPPRW